MQALLVTDYQHYQATRESVEPYRQLPVSLHDVLLTSALELL
jgi:hypothetical protein